MSDEFPKRFIPPNLPEGVVDAVATLTPLLLDGPDPGLAVLRSQFFAARIRAIELTGHGFYAEFDIPDDMPLANPRRFAGGDAVLRLSDSEHGGGCVLHVQSGRLETLEVYLWEGAWSENTRIIEIEDVMPIAPQTEGQK